MLGDEISNRWMMGRLLKQGFDASISTDGLRVTIHGELSERPQEATVPLMNRIQLL
jgi:hypothetical protein